MHRLFDCQSVTSPSKTASLCAVTQGLGHWQHPGSQEPSPSPSPRTGAAPGCSGGPLLWELCCWQPVAARLLSLLQHINPADAGPLLRSHHGTNCCGRSSHADRSSGGLALPTFHVPHSAVKGPCSASCSHPKTHCSGRMLAESPHRLTLAAHTCLPQPWSCDYTVLAREPL